MTELEAGVLLQLIVKNTNTSNKLLNRILEKIDTYEKVHLEEEITNEILYKDVNEMGETSH